MWSVLYFKTRARLTESVRNFRRTMESAGERSRQKDRGFDPYVGAFSRFFWPFRETWLLVVVGSLFILDYTSTYFGLQNANVFEDGPLAAWALRTGGFGFLFVVDMVAAVTVSAVAITARYLYGRFGVRGYGRAAFVVLLAPYVVRTSYVVVNNIILAFS